LAIPDLLIGGVALANVSPLEPPVVLCGAPGIVAETRRYEPLGAAEAIRVKSRPANRQPKG
jgi:hypothetical protein